MLTQRNPNNPFVWNPNYYPNAVPYNQTIFYYVHKVNNIGAFIVGILLVLLLTFLIFFKTPQHFKPYSKMVFLCVITDTIILLSDFGCQSRVRIENGVLVVSFTGPFSRLSYENQCKAMAFQAIGASISAAVLPLQYFYRYRTVKTRKSPTAFQTFLYYCFICMFVSMFGFLSLFSYHADPKDLPNYDYAQLWYEESNIPPLIIGSLYSPWMLIQIIYLAVFLTICYGLTIWLARRTINELKTQEFVLTEKTKSLQKQFSRTLLIQAITPLFTSVVPLATIIVATLFNISAGYVGELIIIGITCFPLLNSLSNIVFIIPYRRYCLRIVPGYTKGATSSLAQPSVYNVTKAINDAN